MELGFIHDMLDVKVLILYVMSRVMYPLTLQKIYELSYQDDCLSYFDLAQAVPDMVKNGLLLETEDEHFVITDKGKQTEAVMEDAIAYSVRLRAKDAVERYNDAVRRSSYVKTEITPLDGGDYSVKMILADEVSDLLQMEMMAPTQRQAYSLARGFTARAEKVYKAVMEVLLIKPEEEA